MNQSRLSVRLQRDFRLFQHVGLLHQLTRYRDGVLSQVADRRTGVDASLVAAHREDGVP